MPATQIMLRRERLAKQSRDITFMDPDHLGHLVLLGGELAERVISVTNYVLNVTDNSHVVTVLVGTKPRSPCTHC